MNQIMQINHDIQNRLCDISARLEEMSPWCDPEFDVVYEDLEREFAHLRLQLGNE
jgi:hypothetical protein